MPTDRDPSSPWRWHERTVLALYGLVMFAARPLLRRKLARRAQLEPGYSHDVPARFGHAIQSNPAYRTDGLEHRPCVWVHAVSLGETRAARVLIQALRARMPGMRLVLTHGTATGRAEGERLLYEGDVQTWLPWDDPWSVKRFFRHHRPAVGVLMETEVWPVLLHQAQRAGVPMVLANARLNERSTRGALRLAWLSRPAYASFTVVGAQTEADVQRLHRVGAASPQVWGNLKFDARPDPAQQAQAERWRQALQRPVLMLASSREGEELEFLKAFKAFTQAGPASAAIKKIVVLVVPRHPQRFDAVAVLAAELGFRVIRRAEFGPTLDAGRALSTFNGPPATPEIDGSSDADGECSTVWLGDSLGEMALYATLADVALLGGSFQPYGGQNLIELAACGCTVLAGPYTFNFAEATEHAVAAGAAHRVADWPDALACALRLLGPQAASGAFEPTLQANLHAPTRARTAAISWAQSHQGAAERAATAIVRCVQSKAHRVA